MKRLFDTAGGSIIGTDHLITYTGMTIGLNNQDAYAISTDDQASILIVTDGCGSGSHSEVGAQLGAGLVKQYARTYLKLLLGNKPDWKSFAWRLEQNLCADLLQLSRGLSKSLSTAVNDYFLFTVVMAVITPDLTFISHFGDGLYAINGQVRDIGSFEGNKPPYLAYLLTGTSPGFDESLLKFQLSAAVPTAEVDSLLLGTDGVRDLRQAEEKFLPGKNERVGALAQFWTDDRYFNNPDNIRRRLALINSTAARVVDNRLQREHGLLPDDTTLVVARVRRET